MACCQTELRAIAAVVALVLATAAVARAAPPAPQAGVPLPPTAAAVKEARDLAKVARKLYDIRQFSAAAELYRKAYRLDYAKPDYLYGVGRCEQRAGHFAAAVVAFEQLLALLPPTDALVPKARAALDEVRAAREADLALPGGAGQDRPDPAPNAPEIAPPQPHTPTVAPAAAERPPAVLLAPAATPAESSRLAWVEPPRRPPASRTPAMVAFGLAAVAGVTGLIAGGAAVVANADANAYRIPDSGAFDPARISKEAARTRIADINLKTRVAGVAGATAAVAGALGAWLWPWATPVAVGVDGEGLVVGGRF